MDGDTQMLRIAPRFSATIPLEKARNGHGHDGRRVPHRSDEDAAGQQKKDWKRRDHRRLGFLYEIFQAHKISHQDADPK